jgi:HlyD family secretion protein
MSNTRSRASSRSRRRLIAAAAVALLAVLAVLALRPSPIPVELAPVTRGPMEVTLEEDGETRVRDRYVVSAPLSGRVLRIRLEPGDPVAAGETVLATFLPNPPNLLDARTRAELQARVGAAEAALNRARAEQQRAEAELAQARRDLARTRRLVEGGALPPERLETDELAVSTLQTTLEAARAGVRAAEAELRMARASLTQPGRDAGAPIEMRSPIDGVVLRVIQKSEAVVMQGEPLLEVGNVARLEIVADFLSTDAVRIAPGQRVHVVRWGGEEELPGRVRLVEPSGFTKISALGVEEQRVNVVIDFDDPDTAFAQLGDRYRVEVRVVVWSTDDAVTVPVSALVRDGDGWAVFVAQGERAVRTPVEIGQRSDTAAQVLGGVEPGARVIVFPSDQIEDGAAIEAP